MHIIKDQILEIKAVLQISKPVTEVFEAIVDPEKMPNYFTEKVAGKWKKVKYSPGSSLSACLKAYLEYGINPGKGAFDFMKSRIVENKRKINAKKSRSANDPAHLSFRFRK